MDNLNSALGAWNEKLAEIWQLLGTTPENFKGGYQRKTPTLQDFHTELLRSLLAADLGDGDSALAHVYLIKAGRHFALLRFAGLPAGTI